jgi:hypothetical protein
MIYDASGYEVYAVCDAYGNDVLEAFDVTGTKVFENSKDYSDYSFIEMWPEKTGDYNSQGFDIKDSKVFWVSKSGNATIPADCYVWYLADGSAVYNAPIVVYSGHGNNISFATDKNNLIASPAYPPSLVYINSFDQNYEMALEKTIILNDGSTDCDACYDPENSNIMYSIGHTADSSVSTAPFYVSRWDLSKLTDNGDGAYTPALLSRVRSPQPPNSYFIQGCKFHDGLLWFASGYYTADSAAMVYGVNPASGNVVISIDCDTTKEPEGLAWVPDASAPGGYALYVGFAHMMLRKYVFNSIT